MNRYGNRTSQTPTGLAVGRVGSPLISYNSQNRNMAWTYDAAGNLTHDNVKAYGNRTSQTPTGVVGMVGNKVNSQQLVDPKGE